ncbi:MAG: VCBS repeat-containing protein [Planctomycetia bacterium]|nr:VCBS repeat-containing protein [Planctomycetia bacterium]
MLGRSSRSARLELQTLEARTVPAFTATLTGATATFVGDSSGAVGDTVIFSQSNGLLVHNRGADAGFASAFDFDSTQTGEQTLAADSASVVNIITGTGADEIALGGAFSTFSAPTTSLLATFDINNSAGNDSLILSSGSAAVISHTFTSASDGTIQIDAQQISYLGVASITDNLNAANRLFTFSDVADAVTLADDTGLVVGVSQISATSTSPTVTFANPTSALLVNADDIGAENDTITLSALEAAFAANIVLRGGDGNDTFNLVPQFSAIVTADGGAPIEAPGDSLVVDVTGATINSLPAPGATDGLFDFANFAPITFTDIETLSQVQQDPPAPPPVPPPAPPPPPVVLAPIAVAQGAGGHGLVSTFDADPTTQFTIQPFAGYTGPVSIASGDVNRDGTPDVIVGTRIGASHIKVLDGRTGNVLHSFFAFNGLSIGVNVGSGDVDGDGVSDIIVGAANSMSVVKVFSGVDGGQIRGFVAFPGFAGGVSVAGGNVGGSAGDDIIVGTATGASHVKVFDGSTLEELRSFFAFNGFAGGVSVGAADLTGDGIAEIIAGTATAAAHVKAFDGQTLAERASFLAFANFAGGVNVAGSSSRIVVGVAQFAPPHVKVFDSSVNQLDSFFAFDVGFAGGVDVG